MLSKVDIPKLLEGFTTSGSFKQERYFIFDAYMHLTRILGYLNSIKKEGLKNLNFGMTSDLNFLLLRCFHTFTSFSQ